MAAGTGMEYEEGGGVMRVLGGEGGRLAPVVSEGSREIEMISEAALSSVRENTKGV